MRRQSSAVSPVSETSAASGAWRVAARASWCRPRPSCTRIRSARMDGASARAAQESGSRAASTAWAPGRSPCASERAARPRARWRADVGSPDAACAVPASRSRASVSGCPVRAAIVATRASRVPRLRASSRRFSASRRPARAMVGCSSATICARRPSRRARWRSPLRLVAISAARTCSASIPRPASRSWSAVANSRCRRCSASVAMSSAGSVPALKGDSDNGVLPGCYQARRKAVLRPSLATAAGTGDQIDEPTGLRRMTPTVRDSTCGNGAIT